MNLIDSAADCNSCCPAPSTFWLRRFEHAVITDSSQRSAETTVGQSARHTAFSSQDDEIGERYAAR
jgi:hypothetical protein